MGSIREGSCHMQGSVPISSTSGMMSLSTSGCQQITFEIGDEGVFKVRLYNNRSTDLPNVDSFRDRLIGCCILSATAVI